MKLEGLEHLRDELEVALRVGDIVLSIQDISEGDNGYDYTLYNAVSFDEIDGGLLDRTDDEEYDIISAAERILKDAEIESDFIEVLDSEYVSERAYEVWKEKVKNVSKNWEK